MAHGTPRIARRRSRWTARSRRAACWCVAIDLTLAPEAPYPACVQDANYGVRWLKSKAASWNGDGSRIGIYGSSSGGHVAGASRHAPARSALQRDSAAVGAERRRDRRLRRDPLADQQHASRASRTPIDKKRDSMIQNNKTFFKPWDTISESNPQEILDRREKVTLVPLLIMQGALDDNVLPPVQEKFAETYTAAGGYCEFHVFREQRARVGREGRAADRSRAARWSRTFIARQLKTT